MQQDANEASQAAGETITEAAVSRDGVVHALPRPARHHDVLRTMRAGGHPLSADAPETQGFTTSLGRFVGRVEGLAIAEAAGQVVHKHPSFHHLYSEDMW